MRRVFFVKLGEVFGDGGSLFWDIMGLKMSNLEGGPPDFEAIAHRVDERVPVERRPEFNMTTYREVVDGVGDLLEDSPRVCRLWERLTGSSYYYEKRGLRGRLREVGVGSITATFRRRGKLNNPLLRLAGDPPEGWQKDLKELPEGSPVAVLEAIYPFGYDSPRDADTEAKRNEAKLFMTADYLRFLLKVEEFRRRGERSPADSGVTEGAEFTPQVLMVKTNPRMAHFMERRWGFRPRSPSNAEWIEEEYARDPASANYSAHLYIPLQEAYDRMPELVEYLAELDERLEEY